MRKRRMTFVLLSAVAAALAAGYSWSGDPTNEEKKYLARAHRSDVNGWIFLRLEGEPFERGFQRGYLTGKEIHEALATCGELLRFETGKSTDFFRAAAQRLFKDKISSENVQEMNGIAAGMTRAGYPAGYDQILLLNTYFDLVMYWWPTQAKQERGEGPGCSAFIATGDATLDGRIVMGHNTWFDYALGSSCNLIVDLLPSRGHRVLMQSCSACLYSATDFFVTAAGLIGTETTIAKFHGYDEDGRPVFNRARRAMQYANSIDEWASIMIDGNNGAYANSWLLGDVRTNEIARLELGLKHHTLQKSRSGYFTGSNVAADLEILRGETGMTWDEPGDIRKPTVARKVRWHQLMTEHHGKIDVQVAKTMLADHRDVYLRKEQPGQRTICGHWELDDGSVPGSFAPYMPVGAFDGKVVDSDMAKAWTLWAKWGGSCDLPFRSDEFLAQHPQYEWQRGHLKDMPPRPWTLLPPPLSGD